MKQQHKMLAGLLSCVMLLTSGAYLPAAVPASAAEDAGIQTYPRREGDRYLRLYLMFGGNREYIYSDTAISDEQFEALEGIKELILEETDS